jgi:mitochondrial import inner membrane translocase subunit TIM16
MASPLGRLIAQILVVGSGIVSKAFVQAYEQAIASTRPAPWRTAPRIWCLADARRQGGTKAAAASLSQALSRKIKPEEARKILNVKEDTTKDDIEIVFFGILFRFVFLVDFWDEQAYKKLFDANDMKNGGSFYLQSKIYRAHECLSSSVPSAAADAVKKPI